MFGGGFELDLNLDERVKMEEVKRRYGGGKEGYREGGVGW